MSKNKIRCAFNRAKNSYDDHCQLQRETGKELLSLINATSANRQQILDLGCGTGCVTQILENSRPHRLLMGMDIAEELLTVARNRLSQSTQLVCADFDNIPCHNQYFDLVFSNMALQWSENLADTLMEIARVTQNNGLLLFSFPVDGTLAELKQLLFVLTGKVYLKEFMSLQNIKQLITLAGYEIIENTVNQFDLVFANLVEALQSIKKVGATGGGNSEAFKKSIYRQILTDKITLSYHIGFFVAIKMS